MMYIKIPLSFCRTVPLNSILNKKQFNIFTCMQAVAGLCSTVCSRQGRDFLKLKGRVPRDLKDFIKLKGRVPPDLKEIVCPVKSSIFKIEIGSYRFKNAPGWIQWV